MRRTLAAALILAACASGPPEPAALDTRNDGCAFCRMAVSDARFAAQMVAPSEEPRFFDDVGCLAGYVAATKALPRGVVLYVADHRTKAWVRAEAAVFTEVPSLATPMDSHLIAHADAKSRDADPDARGGTPRAATELFAATSFPASGR
jgi:copper chaperone NosL